MNRKLWLFRGLLLGLAGLFVGRNTFYGLSPFALSYFSLMFSFSEENLAQKQKEHRGNSFGRRFLGSYGTFLFCAVLMGIVMSSSMDFTEGTYVGTGVRYGIALFFTGMLILWCRQREEKMPLIWVSLCAFVGQMLGTVIMLLLNHDLTGITTKQVVMYFLEALLSFVLIALFAPGLSFLLKYRSGCSASQEELLSAGLIFVLLFRGCPELGVGGISVKLVLMLFFILCAAFFYGTGAGAMSGMLFGLARMQEQLGSFEITELSSLSGISGFGMTASVDVLLFLVFGTVVGVTRYYRRVISVLAGTIAGSLTIFLMAEYHGEPQGYFSVLIAGGLFLLLPQGWCIRGDEIRSRRFRDVALTNRLSASGEDPLFAVIEDKLKENAYAFERLTKYFSGLGKEQGEMIFPDALSMVNDVSGRICEECSMANECSAVALRGNLEATAGILRAAIFEDDVKGSFFPAEFLKGCIHSEDYLYQINREVMLARMNLRWQNNMAETKRAIAAQMKEMSQICNRMSGQLGSLMRVDYPGERKLKYILKKSQVEMKDFSMIRTWEEPLEVYMYARARNGVCMTTRELAKIVGKEVGIRLRASKSTKLVLGKDYEKVTLCEDTTFRLLLGVARCAKSDQEISGDSFSCMNLENGTALLSISDGMGSGQEAFKESKTIMNLLEELIEAGFCEETAIRLIHSVLMEHPEKQSFSTLDVSVVNLYTGILRMVKIGGAATYIKHGSTVETIQSSTLPMGVMDQVDISAIERKLSDGDMVIMMSDGVLEGFQSRLPFETDVSEQMAQVIASQGNMNLKELASVLLKKAGGKENARDDMTVLVAGVFRK